MSQVVDSHEREYILQMMIVLRILRNLYFKMLHLALPITLLITEFAIATLHQENGVGYLASEHQTSLPSSRVTFSEQK